MDEKLKKLKRYKIRIIVISIALVFVTIMSQGSLAYYAVSGTATNVITSGDVHLKIVEKTASGDDFPKESVTVMPGSIVSKIVTCVNTGNHPCWVRIKLTNGITDAPLSSEVFELDINTEDWICGDDGFYYYKNVLAPGLGTEQLFSEVHISDELDRIYANKVVKLVVNAYAVQSEHNEADSPLDVIGWPAEG